MPDGRPYRQGTAVRTIGLMLRSSPPPRHRRPVPLVWLGLICLFLVAAVQSPSDASGRGRGHLTFPGEAIGEVEIVRDGDVAFVEISPFARFASAQGDFGSGAHGTFGIFGEGATSPPHTHTETYYGVVLSGQMNNPFGTEDAPPTLTPGSFWSVPADEQHVTACLSPDQECRFFFHSGSAFDFLPIDELTEPRGDDARAIPVGELDFERFRPYAGAAEVWGDPDTGPFGLIARARTRSFVRWSTHREAFTMVPVAGRSFIISPSGVARVSAGDLIEVGANTPHALVCQRGDDCLYYLFGNGPLEVRTRRAR